MPLGFLAAASLGLVACGAAWIAVAGTAAADPTADPVVAAVHLGVLATLATAILGATHQFVPVITGRPLRSIRLARATLASWLAASWLLPLGVAIEQPAVTAVSGILAGVAVVLLVVDLSGALAARGRGAPVVGLRFALVGSVVTAFLGVAFVLDRQSGWWRMSPRVDLTMGVVGLFGWLGMTYLGVAEKLWPMFLLAHVPGRRLAGRSAVWLAGAGVAILVAGLAVPVPGLAWTGGVVLAAGLGAHLASLASHVRARRRPADLHLAFLVTASGWLVVAVMLALAAAITVPTRDRTGTALAAAALAAAAGWLLEAVVGHAHKVVPFIAWSALRARGVKSLPSGRPLMFADLYRPRWAQVSYATVTGGVLALCAGLASSVPALTAAGGGLLAATGLVVAVNLTVTPLRLLSAGGAD